MVVARSRNSIVGKPVVREPSFVRPLRQPVEPVGQCDVLSRLSSMPSWVEYRVGRTGEFLKHYGIRLEGLLGGTEAEVREAIASSGCKVFLNEVWQLPPGPMASLARSFPEVTFIALNHGSPGMPGEASDPKRWIDLHIGFARLSRELPNCWYGTVMDTGCFPMPTGGKVVSLPNILSLPDGMEPLSNPREIPEGCALRVGIMGRFSVTKNWMGHFMAAGALAQETPINVIVSCPQQTGNIAPCLEWLDLCGVPWTRAPWQGWADYMRTMDCGIDVLFHASVCESFGSIPAEAMMLGIPVVGSEAIGFVPDSWKASIHDPGSVARVALDHVEHYGARSLEGAAIVREIADRNAEVFLKNISSFL